MHTVATAGAHPRVGNPVVSRSPRAPVTADPNVPAADPIPITSEPNIAGCRGHSDDLDLGCRWRNRDDSTAVIPRRRSDDAASQ